MPCLRTLSLNSLGSSETSALLLLLSLTLRNLNMQFSIRYESDGENEFAECVVLSLFQTLPLMSPNLESLEYDLDIKLGHGYIESFRHFTRLKNLSIVSRTPVDEHALGMLSSIPTLRNLSCSIDLSSSSVSRPPRYTFQWLTSLLVRGCFDNLTAFMLACQLPALASIALHIQQPPSTGELVDSFAAICRRCDPALLTSFSVDFAYSIAPLDPSQGILQYFEPLLAFPNIKSFDVEFSCRPMPRVRSMHRLIHDDDFPRFGTAWPRLSSFRVWSSRSEEVARATLSGLIDLARRCPHLDLFHVSELDMGVFPLEKDTALPLNHCLRSFSICRPWLPSPKSPVYLEAATLVGRVFPSIDLDDSQSWILQSNDAEMWKKFLGLSEAMRLGGKEGGLRTDLGQG